MLDLAKATEILQDYFANTTNEQFAIDLRKFCPELFEDETNTLDAEPLKNTEIYRQAQQDSKLEIAPKLLQKGLSIEEVAAILEIDAHLLAS